MCNEKREVEHSVTGRFIDLNHINSLYLHQRALVRLTQSNPKIVVLDSSWSPTMTDQAVSRIKRQRTLVIGNPNQLPPLSVPEINYVESVDPKKKQYGPKRHVGKGKVAKW